MKRIRWRMLRCPHQDTFFLNHRIVKNEKEEKNREKKDNNSYKI